MAVELGRVSPLLPGVVGFRGDMSVELTGITHDSRRVTPGHAFCCIAGATADGHDYAEAAAANGARALVIQGAERLATLVPAIPAVAVTDTRQALPAAANAIYGYPSRELRLVGITGTNGKTSTSYLVDAIVAESGIPTGLLTTLEVRIGPGRSAVAGRTTPEASDLQEALRAMVDAGAQHATMEVSSHALVLGRVAGSLFGCVAFTNLSHDHMDFHATTEDYYEAKRRLFTAEYRGIGSCPAVVNIDDEWGKRLAREADRPVLRVGIDDDADVRACRWEIGTDGTRIELATPTGVLDIRSRLRGLYTVSNVAVAVGIGIAVDVPSEAIVRGVESLSAVPGRLEPVTGDEGQPLVLVDYAHTPDGLRNVLRSVREMRPERVLVVFGCGGDRDRTKRPEMGAIAAELADVAVVTSDNPRSEDPEAIIDEIVRGMPGSAPTRITDRREAIFHAVAAAGPGDIVVIAGKGHETYQLFSGYQIDFDDRQVARQALEATEGSQ